MKFIVLRVAGQVLQIRQLLLYRLWLYYWCLVLRQVYGSLLGRGHCKYSYNKFTCSIYNVNMRLVATPIVSTLPTTVESIVTNIMTIGQWHHMPLQKKNRRKLIQFYLKEQTFFEFQLGIITFRHKLIASYY